MPLSLRQIWLIITESPLQGMIYPVMERAIYLDHNFISRVFRISCSGKLGPADLAKTGGALRSEASPPPRVDPDLSRLAVQALDIDTNCGHGCSS